MEKYRYLNRNVWKRRREAGQHAKTMLYIVLNQLQLMHIETNPVIFCFTHCIVIDTLSTSHNIDVYSMIMWPAKPKVAAMVLKVCVFRYITI